MYKIQPHPDFLFQKHSYHFFSFLFVSAAPFFTTELDITTTHLDGFHFHFFPFEEGGKKKRKKKILRFHYLEAAGQVFRCLSFILYIGFD